MAEILAVKTGKVEKLTLSDGMVLKTAIRKTAVESVLVHTLGAEGDEVADTRHHGGTDKALFFNAAHSLELLKHLLPADYDYRTATLFGENFVVSMLDEHSICIGDRFRIGGALVEVSQPRKPCPMLSQHSNLPEARRVIIETGLVGWYARVLTEGIISRGDAVILVARPYPELTVAKLHQCLAVPAHNLNTALAAEACACDALADAYKHSLATQLSLQREGSEKSAFFNTPWF